MCACPFHCCRTRVACGHCSWEAEGAASSHFGHLKLPEQDVSTTCRHWTVASVGMHAPTHRHTHTPTHTHTHAHTHPHTHTHTHAHAHTHTHTQARTRTRAHTHTHTQARTRTCTHTHTHTHSVQKACSSELSSTTGAQHVWAVHTHLKGVLLHGSEHHGRRGVDNTSGHKGGDNRTRFKQVRVVTDLGEGQGRDRGGAVVVVCR